MNPRIHLDLPLGEGQACELPDGAYRHLVQVLRMQAGDALTVFDGRGGEYEAVLEQVARRSATLRIGTHRAVSRESALELILVQGLSKGERMDWTLQKATELGVSAIVPVITERCNVGLDRERQMRKQAHWQGVIVAACEQSGRTRLPLLHPVQRLSDWFGSVAGGPRYLLDPLAAEALAGQPVDVARPVSLVVGPEGGLSPSEVAAGRDAGCVGVCLGPRVLRTETAGAAALAVLQARAGDLSA